VERPRCVVNVWDLPGEKRPRFTNPTGVASVVRTPGNAAGLTRMGVNLRSVEPGFASTNRHFHAVEEEWVYVLSGRGSVRIGPQRLRVGAGTFVGFPPGPRPHHFLAEGEAPLVLLEGGERRPSEDRGFYVDLGKGFHAGGLTDLSEPLPPEEGDPAQLVALEDRPIVERQHDVDARARRVMRALHPPTGLVRQAVYWARVEPGALSTAYHTHARTDEWIFILSGRARVRCGAEIFEVGAGDFIAHPAGGEPHTMQASEELTYLVGGEIDPEDVVVYPEARLRRRHGTLEPLGDERTATIRLAGESDAEQILGIYGPFCNATPVTFELEPPTLDEMRARIARTLQRYPWLVCERDGVVLGYVYATTFRERAAYQWSVEVTAYMREGSRRAGIGRALYTSLFALLAAQGFRNAYAAITLPNPASVALHEAMGFRRVAMYGGVGYKLGAWHDVGTWHRLLLPLAAEPAPPTRLDALRGSDALATAIASGARLLGA
jgi:uncharacterized cupin superfamily protein/L-amino acid N-acyltransferase YncA